jgi:hypothetical protein
MLLLTPAVYFGFKKIQGLCVTTYVTTYLHIDLGLRIDLGLQIDFGLHIDLGLQIDFLGFVALTL